MRDIFFRGQTRRLGEKVYMNGKKVPGNWVYGGICHGTGDFSIIYGSMDVELKRPTDKHIVYTDTVGQYTGLTDKNGVKIFEGDILKFTDRLVVVTWHKKCACWDCTFLKHINGTPTKTDDRITTKWRENAEVIGNVYDNPELSEG